MRKGFLALAIIPLLALSGCVDLAQYTQFNMDYQSRVVIPSSSGLNLPFNVFTPDVESNAEATFQVNDTRKDLIEEIQLTELGLTLTTPSNSDFSFLKSIEIFLEAEGLSEIRVAWNTEVPENVGSTLDLETTTVDLKEYIKKDSFSLRVNTVTDEALLSDHEIDIDALFYVDAEIFGQ